MSTTPPPVAPTPPVDMRPLPQGLLGWMAFVGIMTILSGALSVLSCVGIISGVLMILAGVAVMNARSSLQGYPYAPSHMAGFFDRLRSYFMFAAWTYIVGFVIGLLLAIFYFGVIMAAVAGAAGR